MAPPQHDVTVGLDALHSDAQIWAAAANRTLQARNAANDIHLDARQFSYFGDQQGLTQTYDDIRKKVVDLLAQGATNFHKISDTLVQVATTYQENEQKVADSLNSIHS